MVVAVRAPPSGKGGGPKLSMLELVSVANNRYKISKLRKRSVGPAFCYVCSRVDPSGLLSKTNAHLYRKGFFQTCEHFPKAPSSTFVEEEGRLIQEDRFGTHTGTNLTKVPSISVTIRKGSRSTNFQSPLKRERTFDSSFSRAVDRYLGSRENSFIKSSVAESADVRLPSISAAATDNNAQTPLSKVASSKLQVPAINDVIKSPFSKESFTNASGTLPSLNVETRGGGGGGGGGGSLSERITVIPTALEEGTSPITGLSSFSKGTTPSATTNDLDTKVSETDIISIGSQLLVRSARSDGDKTSSVSKASALSSVSESLSGRRLDPSALFINRSDGLSAVIQPLVREPVMLDLREIPTAHSRPKAGRRRLLNRGRHGGGSSDDSARSERPESAHLRYHHRAEEDSVPDPGFEIPPTPSDSLSLSVSLVSKAGDDSKKSPDEQRHSRSKSDREPRKSREHQAKGIIVGMSSDDDNAEDGSRSDGTDYVSDKLDLCRCPTNVRDVSFSRNVCNTCENAYYASDAGSTQARSMSLKGTSQTTDASHRRSKYDGKQHRSDADGSTDDVTEIDVKDGQYWSSDDEDFPSHFDESPTAWLKYKHAQPYPLVDPNIHKFVYMQAINAVQLNAIANGGDDYKWDEIEKLRRPHVFSYIPLLKRKDKDDAVVRSIGLRPVKSPKIRNGQYMRHIFGDINPDDFYPAKSRGNRLVFDGASGTTESDSVTSEDESDDKGMQPVLTERSSVSLKMRKEGVNFANEESAEV